MRRLFHIAVLPFCVGAAFAQTAAPADSGRPDVVADKLIRSDSVLRGRGHVRAAVGDLQLQGDEVTVHSDTGEVELRGHVTALLPTQTGHHSIFRYDSGTFVTDKPVLVHADRLSVKDGLLQVWGNVSVQADDPQPPGAPRLQADEMFMYLRTADAELRGNIRTNILPRKRSFPVFPPDIVK